MLKGSRVEVDEMFWIFSGIQETSHSLCTLLSFKCVLYANVPEWNISFQYMYIQFKSTITLVLKTCLFFGNNLKKKYVLRVCFLEIIRKVHEQYITGKLKDNILIERNLCRVWCKLTHYTVYIFIQTTTFNPMKKYQLQEIFGLSVS